MSVARDTVLKKKKIPTKEDPLKQLAHSFCLFSWESKVVWNYKPKVGSFSLAISKYKFSSKFFSGIHQFSGYSLSQANIISSICEGNSLISHLISRLFILSYGTVSVSLIQLFFLQSQKRPYCSVKSWQTSQNI